MKRILIITLEFPPQVGGIATYVEQFAKSLPPEQVFVLAPKQKADKFFDEQLAFKVVRKNLFWPVFIWPRWLKLFFITRKIIKQEKIEVLYIHHILPVGYLGWLMKKIFNIPYLVFSHGTDIEFGTKSPWKRKMLRAVATKAESLIFNSESLKNRLLKILPEFTNKSLVLYPCPEIDFAVVPGEEVISDLRGQLALEGKKIVLTISRIADGKGFPHLLRILPKVLDSIPNLVWLVVGTGNKKDWFLEEVRKNGLQSVVRYLGEIPHDNLKPYYYLADLFVLLTHPDERREEGLGMVFLEAAACGLPVVAGKSGGVEEAVITGQTGLVVDIFKGDEGIVNSIVELLKNQDFAKQLGMNAQERIQTEFIWEKQLKVIQKWL
ncbi:MAG: Glycosyl transferase group 1 [Candidatus Magasanikbacteria bacterium GW2011_GWC2_37_14]|uniref:Glycosyl transferase group 1 n=1 Tax=Candidatus Magasanikbacteria bacterium GW2011_GWC2_37_14 TaxID=1619046 RepID=A0A0G0GAL1_9BACT|nr:MAG: Glycosyl transferase group 1 [Candidatus Magasanikbacteria bacterium GW2011_GWC2_37_14]